MTTGGTSTLIAAPGSSTASDILLAGRTIAGIAAHLNVPVGAKVIDGRGATLLPGLIDCHVHAGDACALGQALAFGITTEPDMFSGPELAAERRSLAARRDDVADIRAAVQGGRLGRDGRRHVLRTGGRRQASRPQRPRDPRCVIRTPEVCVPGADHSGR